MSAVRQKVAIAAIAFVTFIISLALMPAQASAQGISGTISFAESLLPHGFSVKTCQDFQVIAEEPVSYHTTYPVMVVLGKTASGKIIGSVKDGTVRCAYSIEMLQVPGGQVTVYPTGHPRGYKAPAGYYGGFNPYDRFVNGKLCRPSCSFSKVNFVFETIGGTPPPRP